MRALVVGAHDDDAVAWMGGTILRLSDWQWTVISLCRWAYRESDREYFEAASTRLAFTGIPFDFIDNQGERCNDVAEMKQSIIEATAGETFDYVFTHSRSPGGEYGGHCNHDEAREAAVALVQEKKLIRNMQDIVYFAYKSCQPDPAAPFRVDLTDAEVRVKKDLLASEVIRGDMEGLGLWDSQLQEARCTNREAFDTDLTTMPPPFIPRR